MMVVVVVVVVGMGGNLPGPGAKKGRAEYRVVTQVMGPCLQLVLCQQT